MPDRGYFFDTLLYFVRYAIVYLSPRSTQRHTESFKFFLCVLRAEIMFH
ncbi:hypothetical protein Bacsa_1007 [Phocaeicola salanitronis DSM 18170]|uniref:Uncharacterized protein n=1 Tax=Phocaeicola salanitronis (strain DSM 18170 / JCM 13657 / CCUG 60908 / BL78) TaxID=667015 RepID=F0R421_PHOSB|nr:hypothetical protein Bacsa_1007 [Phocaeicola salanitronis DSM 18170]